MKALHFILFALLSILSPGLVSAQVTVDSFNPNAGSNVYTLATQADGKILVGGDFTTLGGVTRNRIARVISDGTVDSSFNPNANGYVFSLTLQADGKVLIAGSFTTVGGVLRNRLARLNSDGTVDNTFNPNVSGDVYSLVAQADGKIIVGGNFTTVGGVGRNRIARLNSDGTLDSSFNPNANGAVNSVALQTDGKILIGGAFNTLGGESRNRIARLDSDGALDSSFNPNANGNIFSLAVQVDGKILVGGNFNTLGGVTRNCIARLNTDGTLDNLFNPNASGNVNSIIMQADGKILIGGNFNYVGGVLRNFIARLNSDGTLDITLNPNASHSIEAVALQADGKILLGGDFTSVGGVARNCIARISNNVAASSSIVITGTSQITWMRGGSAPEVEQVSFESWNGSIWQSLGVATRVSGGWQMDGLNLPTGGWIRARGRALGGQYYGSSGLVEQIINYGGSSYPDIEVTVDSVSSLTNGNATLDFGTVNCFLSSSPKTVTITNNGNAPLSDLALSLSETNTGDFSLNSLTTTTLAPGASTTFEITFSPKGAGALPAMVAISSNDLDETPFTLSMIGNGIHQDTSFNPNVSDDVYSLATQADGKILIGGSFSSIGGVTRNCIARVNSDGTLDSSFNPNANGTVFSHAIQADGKVLIGGSFTSVGDVTHNYIVRLNADGTLDATFNPSASGPVYSLALQPDGKILLAGSFSTLDGVTRNRIARLNADGTLDTSFNPNSFGDIYGLAIQSDGKILVGGLFSYIGGVTRNRIARLNADGTLDNSFNPNADNYVNSLSVQADGKILLGGAFNTVGGISRNRIARLNTDGTLDASFNPNASDMVRSLTIQADGKILMGGDFTVVSGLTRNRVARLNVDGSLDNSFNPGADSIVYALALQTDGKVLLGGDFSIVGGVARSGIARLPNNISASSSIILTGGSQIDWIRGGSVPEIEQVSFESLNGSNWVNLGSVIRVSGGWQLSGLTLPANGWIRARGRTSGGRYNGSTGLVEELINYGGGNLPDITVTVDGGSSLSNGATGLDFGTLNCFSTSSPKTVTITNTGDAPLSDLAISLTGTNPGDFNITSLTTVSLAPGASTSVDVTFSPKWAGVLTASIIIASSDGDENAFTLNMHGTGIHQDTSFNPNASSTVYSLAVQTDGKILIGGDFTNVGGVSRNRIARLNADGTLDSSFDPDTNNLVNALAIQSDGKILIGGRFTTVGGVTRNRIARLNSDGTLDSFFNPNANNDLNSIAVEPSGKILVGGDFTTVGGVTRNRIARLNADGTLDILFNPSASNTVYTLALQTDGNILMGGNFTTVGGVTRNRIARLNLDGTLDNSFNPNVNSNVLSLFVQADGKILMGGAFTTVGGVTRNRIARLIADGTLDDSFNPNASNDVYSMALQADGKILMVGAFTTVGGVGCNRIARLNSDGVPDSSLNPNANNTVYSLVIQPDGKILVGGNFSTVGGVIRSRIARLPNNISASSSLIVSGTSQINWMRGGSAPELGQVSFESLNGNTWSSLGSVTRISGGWQITGLSLPDNGWIRVSGRTSGGQYNSSSGIVEQVSNYGGGSFPDITVTVDGSGSLTNGNSALDFGTVNYLSTSSQKRVTITNTGDAPLSDLAINLTGANPQDFAISSLSTTTLAPGASTTFDVTFSPNWADALNASIVIASNDGDENPFIIKILGTGIHQDPSFNPNASGTVNSVVLQSDGKILLGGAFTSLAGMTRNRIARLNADEALDISFNPDANGTVYSLAIQRDGKILMAGDFTNVSGVTRNRIARLNANGAVDNSFNLDANGIVNSLSLQMDGKILMAGTFTTVGGVTRNRIARLNADGTLDSSFNPDANSTVYSLVEQTDGKILMGGNFTTVGGVMRNRIARLNVDGSLDNSFNPDSNNQVNAIAIQSDGKILIGGTFTNIDGVVRNRIARLNTNGTLDSFFNPDASSTVFSLILQADGKIFMGGNFDTVGGVKRNQIARLDVDGSLDSSFNPNANNSVYSLALQTDGRVLVGGLFTTMGGVTRNRIARLPNNIAATSSIVVTGASQINWLRSGSAPELEQVTFESLNGSNWLNLGSVSRVSEGWQLTGLSLSPSAWIRVRGKLSGGQYNGSSGLVEQIISYGGSLPEIAVTADGSSNLTNGADALDFGTVNLLSSSSPKTLTITNTGNAPLSGLALNLNGENIGEFAITTLTTTTLAPGASTSVDITFSPLNVGVMNASLTIANSDGDENPFTVNILGNGIHEDRNFNPNASGSVHSVVIQADGKILLGGGFTSVGGIVRNRIARLNADATLDNSFNSDASGTVYSIALQRDGKILVGGEFTTLGGVIRNRIARLNSDGTLDNSFNPDANGIVNSLTLQTDGKIFMAGTFTSVGGVTRNRIARLNADGSLDNTFNPNASSTVYSLVEQTDGKILIGGNFITVGGVTRNRVARLNADGSLDNTFNPNASSLVYSLALQADGKVLIGGTFTSVGGVTRNRIARVNTDGSLDNSFNPNAGDAVYTLALQVDGRVLMGGNFTSVGGVTRNRIARLNADGSLDSSFNPNASGSVYSLALQTDGKILMGGTFTTVGGVTRNRIARLPNNIAASSSIILTGFTQIDWMRGGSSPEIEQVIFESLNGSIWVNLGSVTRVSGGWQLTGLNLPSSGWIRARGRTSSGQYTSGSGLVEQVISYGGGSFSDITVTVDGSSSLINGNATLDFGSINLLSSSVSKTVTITNTGDAPLSDLALSLSETSIGNFATTSLTTTTLAPGASTTFNITFSPVTFGDFKTSLTIVSNDGDENPFTLTMVGSGIQQDPNFNPNINDTVRSMAVQADGKILIAGDFTSVGGVTRYGMVRLNADGTLDTSFNQALFFSRFANVLCIAIQPDGKILIGGSFTDVDGVTRNRIARLNTDGTVDDNFNPNAYDGVVNSLAVQADGKILMGGSFTIVDWVGRNRIARLNSDGTVDTSFNPNANNEVFTLAVQSDGKILMGGNFTAVGVVARNRIARLNGDGTLDGSFNPNVNNTVGSIVLQVDGKILLGGNFTTVGGVTRNRIARLNEDGSIESSFNPNASGWVRSYALQADGKILMGGDFTNVGGVTRNYIARLSTDGTLDNSFNPNADNFVYSLGLQADGNILVGGSFTTIGGVTRNRIARLPNNLAATSSISVNGTSQIDWLRGGSAPELEQVSFEILNGISWVSLGQAARVSGGWQMTGLNLPTSAWIRARGRTSGGICNSSSGFIEQMISYGNSLPSITVTVDGGSSLTNGAASLDFGTVNMYSSSVPKTVTITNTGNAPLSDLAISLAGASPADFTTSSLPTTTLASGASTSFDITFSPVASGAFAATLVITSNDADDNPFTLTLLGANVLEDASYNPNANNAVFSMVMQADGKILLAGSFTSLGGVARNRIARLNANGTLDTSFNPDASNTVYSLAVQADGKILIGGAFTSVGGVTRNRIARLNADGTLDTSFDPNASSNVYSLAMQPDGKILIGGIFNTVGGLARNRIARLNADGALDTSFNPNADDTVYSLAVKTDGKILIAGYFTTVGGVARNRIALLEADGSLDNSFNPDPNYVVYSLASQPDGKTLLGGSFTTVGGVSRNRIARLNTDGTLDSSFIPNVSGSIYTMAIQADGKILIGGFITAVGGVRCNRIARLNADGTFDNSLNPNANGSVYSLALQSDGNILIGGSFTTLGGVARNRIARFPNNIVATSSIVVSGTNQIDWARGGSAPELEQVSFERLQGSSWVSLGTAIRVTGGWQMTGLDLPTSGWMRARGRVSGGQYNGSSGLVEQVISHGADFPNITVTVDGGSPLTNSNANLDFGTINCYSTSSPKTVTISNTGDVPLSGLTLSLNGSNPDSFAFTALTATTLAPGASTTFDISFSPLRAGVLNTSLVIASDEGYVIPFTLSVFGTSIHQDPNFNPNANGTVYSMVVQPNGKILIGGDFTTLGGVSRNRIARINADGTLDSSFNSDVSDNVNSIALQADGKILIGGTFTTVNGIVRNRIARLNSDGSLDGPFNPNADGSVYSLSVQTDGKILMGGSFSSVNGFTRNYIARLKSDGTLDVSFNQYASSYVYSMVIQADGKVLIGGLFTSVGGVARNQIARLNSDGTLDSSFNPNASSNVFSLALQADGKILMGGNFTTVSGVMRNRIARLNADGTLDTSFDPNASSHVYTLNVQADGKILMGGDFTTLSGVTRNRIARLNVDGTLDNSFNPNASSIVYSLTLQSDGKILLGGGFSNIGGETRNRIARLSNYSANSSLVLTGNSQIDWVRGGSAPELEQVSFESLNGSNWVSLGSVARVSGGWRLSGLNLPSNAWIRARGKTSGGQYNGSSGIVEQMISYGDNLPEIAVEDDVLGNMTSGGTGLNFGNRSPGSVTQRVMTIRNVGTSQLSGLVAIASGTGFSVSAPVVNSLAPGASTTCTLLFRPNSEASFSGSLSILSNDGDESPFVIALSGSSSLPPEIVLEQPVSNNLLNGATSSLGNVVVNQSLSRVFTIRNTGASALNLGAINLSGTNAADFTLITAGTSSSVIANKSTTLLVIFQPATGGTKNATLTIPNNDENENPFTLYLTGAGVTAAEVAFNSAAQGAGLVGNDALLNASPFNDGVQNLLKYAFNMNLAGPDNSRMTNGGNSGLPLSRITKVGETDYFQVQYVVRKGSGLVYIPQKSTSLAADSFNPMTGAVMEEDIDTTWKRVTINEPHDPVTLPKCFFRVQVSFP